MQKYTQTTSKFSFCQGVALNLSQAKPPPEAAQLGICWAMQGGLNSVADLAPAKTKFWGCLGITLKVLQKF
jgi:hypothetical protein